MIWSVQLLVLLLAAFDWSCLWR